MGMRIGILSLAVSGIMLAGCDNTLQINGNYTERVVVVGLLDHGLDTNYLRIQRSFLDDNTSALILADDPGENFYTESELTVYLEQWKDGIMQSVVSVEYVNGDTLGIEKPEGIFASSPNILYRITTPIDSMSAYKLMVIKNETQDTIYSETEIVGSYYLYYPTQSDIYISYADTGLITYTCKQAVNAMLYDLNLTMYYAEKNTITGDSTIKSITWNIFSNKQGTNADGFSNISYSVSRHAFYSFLRSALDVDPDVIRYCIDLQFDWYAGGEALYDQYINLLANLGINEDYISPEYTNITGGLGIFSSRHKESAIHVKLSDDSLDSLACGTTTAALRFASSPSNPAYPGCSF